MRATHDEPTTTPAPRGSASEPIATPPRTRGVWLFLLIALVAVALRIPYYTESVWVDELYTSNIFCGHPVVLLKTLYSDIHPPIYFLFIHLWNGIFGDREVWLRLPPLLFGLGTIFCAWRLGRLFAGNTTGLVAAALLALSPIHIWYSQEARPYSASMFATSVVVLTYYRLLIGHKGFWLTATFFGASFCLAFIHYYNVAFAGALLVLTFVFKSPHRKRLVIINGLMILMAATYLGAKIYFSYVPTEKGTLRAFGLEELWQLLFRWFLLGDSDKRNPSELISQGMLVLQALAVLAFLRGTWQLLRRRRRSDAPAGGHVLLMLMVLPTFLLGLTLIGKDSTYIERSALPALPFFAIVMAAGLTGFRWSLLTRGSLGLAGVAAALVLTFYFTRGPLDWTVYKPNPDWRSLATYLGKQLPADGEDLVPMYSVYESPTPLTYYDPRMQEAKNFARNDARTAELKRKLGERFGADSFITATATSQLEELDQLLAAAEKGTRLPIHYLSRHDLPFQKGHGARSFWLLYHGWPGQPPYLALDLLHDSRVRVVDERRFRTLTLYRIERTD